MSNPNDRRFDDAMRQRHADAVARRSPRTQAQLAWRQRAAAAPGERSPLRTLAWPWAAACAAGVLAIGLQVRRSPDIAPAPAPSVAIDADDDFDSAYSALDEAPELYLWLASSDAATFAPE